MSVLIRGMEMPKTCDDCYIREGNTCPLLKTNVGGWGRCIGCPLIEIPPHGDWIPVTERLPEEEESVLVVRKFLGLKGQVPTSTYVEIAYRIDDKWVADSDEYKIARNRHTDPLYWMPLPEPPKGEWA